jgi:hypothetical protein
MVRVNDDVMAGNSGLTSIEAAIKQLENSEGVSTALVGLEFRRKRKGADRPEVTKSSSTICAVECALASADFDELVHILRIERSRLVASETHRNNIGLTIVNGDRVYVVCLLTDNGAQA